MPDMLDERDLIATFDADFRTPPKLRAGRVTPQPYRPLQLHDPAFTWISGYIHALPMIGEAKAAGHPAPAWSSLGERAGGTTRREAEVYPNADAIAATGVSPFRTTPEGLQVTASRMPERLRASVPARLPDTYLSGALVTYPFGQRYGVFAMRARLPQGRGLWPAFWLLPCDMSWPPEIDVMEVLGEDPSALYTSIHTKESGHNQHFGKANHCADLSLAFNTYAVDWGPDFITFFLNRRALFRYRTPADLHKPCYVLLNLAVGTPDSWPGAPDQQTRFPASMTVAGVRAWQRRRYADKT